MKRTLVLLFCATAFMLMSVLLAKELHSSATQTVSISNRWERVEELKMMDRPKSILRELIAIQNEAIGEQGIADRVKASLLAIETTLKIDDSKGDSLATDLERKIAASHSTIERTFLRFGLFELLLGKDVTEKEFETQLLPLSELTPKELNELSKVSTQTYISLLRSDSAWVELYPTLDDYFEESRIQLLSQRHLLDNKEQANDTILLAPRDCFLEFDASNSSLSATARSIVRGYQYLLREKGVSGSSLLLRDLNRLRLFYNSCFLPESLYVKRLEQLLTQHEELPLSVEVVEALSHCKSYRENEEETVKLLNRYIERYANYARIDILRNRRNELLRGNFTVRIPRQAYPNQEFNISITYRKVKRLGFTIRRYSKVDTLTCFAPINPWQIQNRLQMERIKPDSLPIWKKELNLPFSFKEQKENVKATLNDGFYRCDLWEGERICESFYIVVNRYHAVARSYNGVQDILIADFKSGQPLSGVDVEIWEYNRTRQQSEPIATFKSDRYGRIAIPESTKGNMFRVVNQQEKGAKWGDMPFVYRSTHHSTDRQVSIYLDRPAYRPGQTLRFGGLVWDLRSRSLEQGESFNVRLKEIYGKVVYESTLKSNSFGSLSGEIELPKHLKGGRYFVEVDDKYSVYFSIEEYKRPKLSVQIEKIILLNENQPKEDARYRVEGVVVASNGVGLANCRVRYFLKESETKSDTLTVETDRSGRFSILQSVKRFSRNNWWQSPMYLRYPNLVCEATDTKGETQSQSTVLASTIQLEIKCELPEVILTDKPYSAQIVVARPHHSTTVIGGDYQLQRHLKKEEWETVESGKWEESQSIAISNGQNHPTGRYRLCLNSDYFGKDSLLATVHTALLDSKSKKTPIQSGLWSYLPADTVEVGKEFELWIGSSRNRIWAMVELMNGNQFISRQYVLLNDNLNKLRFTYRPEWGKSVSAVVSAFGSEKYNTKESLIVGKEPDQRLQIEIKTVRNVMLPGEKESWTLSIKDSKGNAVVGEVIATLFDASLEQIQKLDWNKKPFFKRENLYLPNLTSLGEPYNLAFNLTSAIPNTSLQKLPLQQFPRLLNTRKYGYSYIASNPGLLRNSVTASIGSKAMEQETAKQSSDEIRIRGYASPKTDAESSVENNEPSFPVRQNFNESVFFFAQLRTNNKGEVKLPFTLPESLTSYSLRILAHDRKLRSGYTESTIRIEKPIMIGGNVPRLVYEGDSVRIKAIVFNLSDRKRSIRTSFTLGTTNRPIGEMVLEAGEQRDVECSFVVPSDSSTVTLTLSASTDGFGDAERHLIPVRPRSQQIRETQLFNFPQGGTFTINKPFDKSSIGELDVTYIGSPIYHLLEALPSVPMPQSESMTAFLNAYYLNRGAERIGQRFVFERKEKATPEQLLVIQNRLLAFQDWDGGFRWFECMPSSTMMTLLFLETTQRLGVNIGCDLPEEIKMAQIKALKFVDERLVQNYREDSIRAVKKSATPMPYFTLYYMSVRGQFRDIPLAGATLTAHHFYFDRLVKERKDFSLAQKGLLASALFRYGRLDEAREVIHSLREYTVYSPEKGRYFANNRNPIYHNLRNINTQTEIMEAFALNRELVKEEQQQTTNELNEMSTWLIYQKQGQDWGNAVATINALNAILSHGVDPKSLTMKGREFARINLPATRLTEEKNASQSYRFTAEEWKKIEPRISIEKKTTDYSRLMVTWERRSPLEKIEPSQGDLTIRQELIGSTPLKIGAATIRLTLTSKRDLDYVVVRSSRGACMEPTSQNSNYESSNQLWYYKEVKDEGTNLYIEHLPRGTYTVDLPVWINLNGVYQQGVPTVESLFAPEFNGVGQAQRITIPHY